MWAAQIIVNTYVIAVGKRTYHMAKVVFRAFGIGKDFKGRSSDDPREVFKLFLSKVMQFFEN